MKTIAQRELRNQIARVLRQVEAGERMRVTVNGRAVAELSPLDRGRRTFVPREALFNILKQTPLDPSFRQDLGLLDSTVEEL